MKLGLRITALMLVVLCASCGGNKKVTEQSRQPEKERRERRSPRIVVQDRKEDPEPADTPRTYTDKVAEYIRLYAPIAQEEMELYKIPASITLAQGILESGAGEGSLSRRANNHFGIKCHGWEGGKVYHDDDRAQECFRKYKDVKYSFRDHSLFLSERGRYAALFDLDPQDYRGWAHGLRAAGYATDRKYPEKLISLIERYQLYKYDTGVPAEEVGIAVHEVPGEQYMVRKGDTLYAIAKRFNMSVEDLQRINHLTGTNIGVGQILQVR